jgi:hypothetical protein
MRVFLTIVVPLILPTLLYMLYLAARRPRLAGQPTAEEKQIPWLWLVAIGAVLMVITFFAVAHLEDAPPGSHYEPAKVKDGRIEPGHLE